MRITIALLALVIALFVGIAIHLAPLDPSFICLQLSFSEQSFNAILSEWQPEGISLYRSHFPADFLLLTAYGVLGWQYGRTQTYKVQDNPMLIGLLTWTLPLASVADAIENVIHLVLTTPSPSINPVLYLMSGSAASIKFLGIVLFLLALVLQIRSTQTKNKE
jgi:hypothetical protein